MVNRITYLASFVIKAELASCVPELMCKLQCSIVSSLLTVIADYNRRDPVFLHVRPRKSQKERCSHNMRSFLHLPKHIRQPLHGLDVGFRLFPGYYERKIDGGHVGPYTVLQHMSCDLRSKNARLIGIGMRCAFIAHKTIGIFHHLFRDCGMHVQRCYYRYIGAKAADFFQKIPFRLPKSPDPHGAVKTQT